MKNTKFFHGIRFFSLGPTVGKPLSFLKELKGSRTFNLGVTTLLGKPRYAVAIFQEHISNVKR